MRLQDLIATVQEYNPTADFDLIRKAYAFVRHHHQGQTRASGEPYITHVSEVAALAAKLKLDTASIATALLHDTVEDTDATLELLRTSFGPEIAELVDGVTKLSQVNFSSREEAQAENFRKMLLAMARDIRVLLIKLCDRLHNMRTLEFLSEARQQRIAEETLEIYAPLSHRLGIYWMKSELEDLSLRYLKPQVYENIKQQVNKKKKERDRYIEEVVELLTREIEQNGIKGEVYGRSKHFYSIFEKMERQGLSFDEIYDLIGFRIIVQSTMDCYAALGVIHAAWKPIPGRFKDYIAMPKANRYQSLHTTVIGPHGHRIEIQLRTPEMHEIAEKGIAAHWAYKEGSGEGKQLQEAGRQFVWLKNLIESEKMLHDPHEFLSIVKDGLFPHEVFVFSPKGDLIALSAGATPIDFAYAIHSEVGDRCIGARVNGQQVSLVHKLQNGDTVEIITSPNQTPNKDWLAIVATSKAKQRIRQWLRGEERSRSIVVGKELLAKDLKKVKQTLSSILKDRTLEKAAQELGLRDVDALFADIGYGKISTGQIVAKLFPNEADLDQKLAQDETALQKIFDRAAKTLTQRNEVKVSGIDNVVFRFAHCCEPLPGDDLVGFISRGRGVSIHTRNCPQAMGFDPRRLIPVAWDEGAKAQRKVKLKVVCMDKIGMLANMTQCIANNGASIVSANVALTGDGKAVNSFEIAVESLQQLETITRFLEAIEGVIRVERFRKPAAGGAAF